jgi:lactoylglutathione lyase
MLGLWHFSFTVSDLDEAIDFYVDVLGCTLVHRQAQDNEYTRSLVGYPNADLRIAQIRIGDGGSLSTHDLELVQYLTPRGERGDTNICNPGAAHLAFAVEDLPSEYERLTARGIKFFSAPNQITAGVNAGGAAVYFYGPDDIVHEMVQPPRRAPAAG